MTIPEGDSGPPTPIVLTDASRDGATDTARREDTGAASDTGRAPDDVGGRDAPPRDVGVDVPIAADTGTVVVRDATADTGRDAGVDVPAVRDTGVDTGRDAGMDVPVARDTGSDTGRDTGSDTGRDTGVDTGRDTGFDTGVDTGVDAGFDAGVDTGGTTEVPPDTIAFTGSFPATTTGATTARLTVGGVARTVRLQIPRTRPANPAFVMVFHGSYGGGDEVMNESGARTLATSAGVIVAAPEARYQSRGDWDHPDSEGGWWETHPNVDPDANADLLLVRAMIVAAQRAYDIDPDRVYAMGHSNGAFFAQLAAMRLNDRVAAFASSSGGLVRCATTLSCRFMGRGSTCDALSRLSGWCGCTGVDKPGPITTTGRLPAAYLAHGTLDNLVSVYYSCTLASRLTSLGYDVSTNLRADGHVVPSTFAQDAWPFLQAHPRR